MIDKKLLTPPILAAAWERNAKARVASSMPGTAPGCASTERQTEAEPKK